MRIRARWFLSLFAWSCVAVVGSGCDSGSSEELMNPPGQGGGACKADTECSGSTPVCDLLAGKCVQCLFDTQCGGDAQCRGTTCVDVTTCASSLDCVKVPGATICDPVSSTCVACSAPVDCTGTADCIDNLCVPYDACTSSLDCPNGKVCASLLGRCVECETAADCKEGDVCVGNACETRTECQSDNQCTPSGKLCDKTLGYCVDCLTNAQCPDAYHCALGACALDQCQAGASACQGNAVVSCDASGETWGVPQPCPAGSNCKASGINATCETTVCTPGMTYCQADTLITCAADGLSIISSVNCATQQKHCSAGECRDQICAPNTVYCEGLQIRQCNADGTDSFVVQTCGPQQMCNPTTATCVSQLCTPNAPVCNGSLATTCNGTGTGYAPGGTDCSLQGKGCDMGSCVGCPGSGVAPSNVRLTEVFLGTDDYIMLTNLGSCSAQLDTLSIRIASNDPVNDIEIDIPSRILNAGASVYVSDVNSAGPDDISSPDNIYLTPDTGEYVMLCSGPCASGVVQDYFAHASGLQPPLPPGGITFTPSPLTGITQSNQDTNAYKRVGYAGGYPSFKASDWQMAAASRPYQNPTGCPPTMPVNGSACSLTMQSCLYGAVTCFCLGQWVCQ